MRHPTLLSYDSTQLQTIAVSKEQLNQHNNMFSSRPMLRASQRLASPLHTPAVRASLRRRFASTESSAFHGAENNAFNRERKAVKDHAAATSGTYIILGPALSES
jgi:hypothetical protein